MSTLIPEQRVNKNGVSVLKHVKPDKPASKRSGSTIPAPSIGAPPSIATTAGAPLASSDPKRVLKLRDKFQLESRGERDLEDASYIRRRIVLDAERYKKYPDAYGQAKTLLVKTWQESRLPDPLFASIRPIEYPWSKTARDMFFSGETTSSLTLEHVKPVFHLVTNVLFPAVEDPDYTDEMFLDLLVQEHSRLSFTVLTNAEDSQINKHGYKYKHVESEDDWARYKKSKLDTSTFKALIDDDRFNVDTMTKVRGGKRKVVLHKDWTPEMWAALRR